MTNKLRVVGIGASAGGLDAIQKLFDTIPSNTGMVFIIIQHLSPDFKSLMPELLAKHTKMKVFTAGDKMKIEPNCIYLNTSKKNLHIKGDMLYHLEKGPRNSLNLPIDIFFHTLGEEFKENATGIILSGTGSDGSRGIRTIKSYGGTVIVQEPKSAQFDGMPNSAIDTNMYDYVKVPEQMLEYLGLERSSPIFMSSEEVIEKADTSALNNILNLVFKYSGIDFREYKKNTLIRRIEKRMQIHKMSVSGEYFKLLGVDEKELTALRDDFLIGVTHFFRDTEAFQSLEENVIPKLCSNKNVGDTLRIWIPGCSTGEEAYSLAMLLDSYITTNDLGLDFKIFATDVDNRSLPIANLGEYPINVISEIDKKYFEKYFDKTSKKIQIIKRLREKILFSHHNIIKDPPYIKLDLISCRNLLIYLDKTVQQKVMENFQFGLNSFGFLFLGKSESLGAFSKYYKTIDATNNIYQSITKKKTLRTSQYSVEKYNTPKYLQGSSMVMPSTTTSYASEHTYHKYLSERYAPSSIFINKDYDILFIKGSASQRLMHGDGVFERNLLKMISPSAAKALRNGISLLKGKGKPVKVEGISTRNDEATVFDIYISSTSDAMELTDSYLIEFTDDREKVAEDFTISKAADTNYLEKHQIEELENELKIAKTNLQHTVEELETSNEELQSSNEELMSSNEELQSTNEELQSVNEELFSANSEMFEKNNDLNNLNSDITNLFNNTQIATLFLDKNLAIRKFTPAVKRIFNLNDTDLGRTIDNFTSTFDESTRVQLIDDAKLSLNDKQIIEDEVSDTSGNHYLMRISPFLNLDEHASGVIVTFDNINKLKEKEKLLNVNERNYKKLFANLSEGFIHGKIITDTDGKPSDWQLIDVNQMFEKQFNTKANHLIGENITKRSSKAKTLLNNLFDDFGKVAQDGIEKSISNYTTDDGKHYLINIFSARKTEFAATFTDITELQSKNDQLLKSEAELERVQELTRVGSWFLNITTGKVTWSKEVYRIFRRPFDLAPPNYEENSKYYSKRDWLILTRAIENTIKTSDPYELELKIKAEDGSVFWLWIKGEIINDDIDEATLLRGSVQDITKKKNEEEELLNAKKEAVIANTHKDYFLSNISHEIRTPVTSIIGFSELLKNNNINKKESIDFLNIIDNNSKQLINLIDDIIDISKIETNKINIEYADCNIVELLKSIHLNYNHVKLYRDKDHLEIICNIPENYDALHIRTDRYRLEQVLSNLLNNAIKFSDQGVINFGFEVENAFVKFYIEDRGIGISSEDLVSIFDRFRQVDQKRNVDFGGTGLGLSICKGIVELMGGDIWAESQLGVGSTFCFTIPLTMASSASRQHLVEDTNYDILNNKTVLIAEDSKLIQLLFKKLLEKHHINILFADNGKEAIELYANYQSQIDLVLLDIRMPELSGTEVLSKIIKINPRAKVIMQSAHTMADEKRECFSKGCVDFVQKPIVRETLFQTLVKWMV